MENWKNGNQTNEASLTRKLKGYSAFENPNVSKNSDQNYFIITISYCQSKRKNVSCLFGVCFFVLTELYGEVFGEVSLRQKTTKKL